MVLRLESKRARSFGPAGQSAFLVFGPKKLPELGRTLGKGIRELKSAMRGVTESFSEAESDLTDSIKKTKDDLEDSIEKSIGSNIKLS